MAQRTQVTVTCDIDGKHDDGVDTVTIVDSTGAATEIDLCARHMEPVTRLTGKGRPAGKNWGPGSARRAKRTAISRARSEDIRKWAADHGHVISERGRIPSNVVADYEAAH